MRDSLSNRTFRILVVDDSRNIHDDFNKVLGRPVEDTVSELEAELFGDKPATADPAVTFELASAFQGDDGVAMAQQAVKDAHPFALAFVDMRMPPGMDGLGTIAKLWEVDPTLQVVICSAYSDYSWSEIMSRLGRTDRLVILRKPFDNIEVLQLAHTLSTKWSLQRQVESHLDDLEELVKQRTRALHDSQALFRLILENANDLITVVDRDSRRVYNSPAHQRIIGYSNDELAGLSPTAFVHKDDILTYEAAMERSRETLRSVMVVARKQHKEGFWLHFESLVGAVRNDDGDFLYLVIIERDITERHQQEVQVRLNQKLESIGSLAAGIAHEINTPTQFISDNLDFLQNSFAQLEQITAAHRTVVEKARAFPPMADAVAIVDEKENQLELGYLQVEIPRTLEQSLQGINRVGKIVRSLKEFSHPGSPTRAPVDLNHAIENAAMVCRHEWKYVAELKLSLDPKLPHVPCLADELNQAILNLIINAAHAIADKPAQGSAIKGVIGLRTRQETGWAVIEISDTGTGIPESIRERIFEPFFTTKSMGRGTGQGLPIVRSVVVGKHQGKIDFVTEQGKGTTFILHLPTAIPSEPEKVGAN